MTNEELLKKAEQKKVEKDKIMANMTDAELKQYLVKQAKCASQFAKKNGLKTKKVGGKNEK